MLYQMSYYPADFLRVFLSNWGAKIHLYSDIESN